MNWMDARADKQLAEHFDQQQYDETSLIEISVPVNLPYTNNWTAFERIDGAVVFNGHQYNYVMRKMENGKMIYKCLPNEERNKISNARTEFFKLAFDFNKIASSKKQDTNKTHHVKKAMDDFTYQGLPYSSVVSDVSHPLYITANAHLANGFYLLPVQPPRA